MDSRYRFDWNEFLWKLKSKRSIGNRVKKEWILGFLERGFRYRYLSHICIIPKAKSYIGIYVRRYNIRMRTLRNLNERSKKRPLLRRVVSFFREYKYYGTLGPDEDANPHVHRVRAVDRKISELKGFVIWVSWILLPESWDEFRLKMHSLKNKYIYIPTPFIFSSHLASYFSKTFFSAH